jgi:hypothetical protein
VNFFSNGVDRRLSQRRLNSGVGACSGQRGRAQRSRGVSLVREDIVELLSWDLRIEIG